MPVNNSQDERINARSPYYIEAGREAPAPIVVPPPIENNTPPTVTILASNETPVVGQTVTLTAIATDSDGTIVSYLWGGEGSGSTISIDITSSTAISQQFSVVVTDDDGDTATDTITINWQEPVIQKPTVSVACGDTYNEAAFVGTKTYNLLVGDKIGDVTIALREPYYTSYDIPVKFDLDWNGTTASTGYVGHSDWHDPSDPDDNTSIPSNKTEGTTVTVAKTAATPDYATLTATVSTAQDIFPNDTYTFELICPNTEAVQTFYYTLEGTCTSGNTQFTYTDVNGDTQTVTLANGETQLVSAQEDTVSVAVCTGTTEKGGQSFDKGTPDQDFDKNIELNILFDDSGSMNSTLQPLLNMVEGNLKETLLSYYENDVAKYEQQVNVYKTSDFNRLFVPSAGTSSGDKERFLRAASVGKTKNDSTKSIYLVFQDEASGINAYQSSSSSSGYFSVTTKYIEDLSQFRSFLDSTSYGEFFMRFFVVESSRSILNAFLQNIFSGNEGFTGSKGLSDRSEVSSVGILTDGVSYKSNPNYYYDYVIQALRDYGFNI